MTRFRFPFALTLTLSTLALGAVGCSNGSSPTEPAFDSLEAPVAATSSSSFVSEGDEKRRGSDDDGSGGSGGNSTDDNGSGRRGRGSDDPAGDDRGGRRGGRGGRGGTDDRPRNDQPRNGAEFEARVLSVSGNTLNLAGGTRVVVNGATQWSARGDLRTLAATATAVSRNRPVRAEGRGTRQADGSFIAQTLKVEVDD